MLLLRGCCYLSFLFFIFFFLMIRRPPRSTLFPLHDALPIWARCCSSSVATVVRLRAGATAGPKQRSSHRRRRTDRSEERRVGKGVDLGGRSMMKKKK